MAGYFSFHKMVSTTIIKGTYITGLIVITAIGVMVLVLGAVGLAQQTQLNGLPLGLSQPVAGVVAGLLILLVGNLAWRLLCEGWILVFSMHEMIASIERSLAGGEAVESAAYQRRIT